MGSTHDARIKNLRCTIWISQCMSDPRYELAVTILGALNLVCISIRDLRWDVRTKILVWPAVQVIINAFFLIEMIVDLMIHGLRAYKKSFRIWPETICQILNVYTTYLFFSSLQ